MAPRVAAAVMRCLVAVHGTLPGGQCVPLRTAFHAASTRAGDGRRGGAAGRECWRGTGPVLSRPMSLAAAAGAVAPGEGLGRFSIETTPKLSARIPSHGGILPPGTLVYVAAIPGTALQVLCPVIVVIISRGTLRMCQHRSPGVVPVCRGCTPVSHNEIHHDTSLSRMLRGSASGSRRRGSSLCRTLPRAP